MNKTETTEPSEIQIGKDRDDWPHYNLKSKTTKHIQTGRPMTGYKAQTTKPYPEWLCAQCGDKYGRRKCDIATWHHDNCEICGCNTFVTEPRDFGHLKSGWDK